MELGTSKTASPQLRDQPCYPQPTPESGMCLIGDRGREKLEQYISSIFQASYGARIFEYLPMLFNLNREGSFSAALGLRSAAREALFCESYLDAPLETHVQTLFGANTERHELMELGNLVSSRSGDAALLYVLITAAIHMAGVRYLLFAANTAVRQSIKQVGFTPKAVCAADPGCLPDSGESWGSYYRGNPQVMIGDMALTNLQSRANPHINALLEMYAGSISELSVQIRSQLA
ncbi:MAG: thermostable hemolysin [Halioglobus sp.]